MANIQPVHIWSLIAAFVVVQIITALIRNWMNSPKLESDERRKGMQEVIAEVRGVEIKLIEGIAEIKTQINTKADKTDVEVLRNEFIAHTAKDH